jgi:hypothetical protein
MYDGTLSRRIEIVRLLVSMRKIVGEVIGYKVCPNPIFDMLLELYLARHEHREVYLYPLCIVANCAVATGHRKVLFLERRGLVDRLTGSRDKRRLILKMTDGGGEMMDGILDRMTDLTFDTCITQRV